MPKFEGTVLDLLYARLQGLWMENTIYKQNVFDPLMIEPLFSCEVKKLSGGEMQRVGLAIALGR